MTKIKKQKVHFRRKKKAESSPVHRRALSSLKVKTAAKFLAGTIFLAAIGFGLVRLKYMFVGSDHFTVKGVDLELRDPDGSLRNLPLSDGGDGEILGRNIFFVDLNDFKGRIETSHPEFKDIIVKRLLPDRLVVEAELRKAVAQMRSDRYYPVDAWGVLLPDVKNFPDNYLPIISGIGVNLAKLQPGKFSKFERDKLDKALSLIRQMQEVEGLSGYKLKMVDITDPGNLSFFLEDINVEIKIGNSDFGNRLKVLRTVFDQLGADISEFKYIDLRFEDPIIGPR